MPEYWDSLYIFCCYIALNEFFYKFILVVLIKKLKALKFDNVNKCVSSWGANIFCYKATAQPVIFLNNSSVCCFILSRKSSNRCASYLPSFSLSTNDGPKYVTDSWYIHLIILIVVQCVEFFFAWIVNRRFKTAKKCDGGTEA